MKTIVFCIGVFITAGWLLACNNSGTMDTESNSSNDTAILVQDSANTLNARPINDTTIKK